MEKNFYNAGVFREVLSRMVISWGLIVFHVLLLLVSLATMLNRYLQHRWMSPIGLGLNMLVPVLIISIGLNYGVPAAAVSILLFFMYMVTMNTLVFNLIQRMDKSSALLEELKKKLGDQEPKKRK